MSLGDGIRAGNSLARCMVVLLKRREGQVWPGEPPAWPPGSAQLAVSWGRLLQTAREAASQPGAGSNFLSAAGVKGGVR